MIESQWLGRLGRHIDRDLGMGWGWNENLRSMDGQSGLDQFIRFQDDVSLWR
jgi:hypothetical protein